MRTLELTPEQPAPSRDDDRRMATLFCRPGKPRDIVHCGRKDRRDAKQEDDLGPADALLERSRWFRLNEQQERNPAFSNHYSPKSVAR
jgi:hypothetical protein